MRNLKKLLAVITVVALMATLFVVPASAAGLSDIAGTKYESAAARLNALGIITGRDDGKFYPDDTITRAEFAAVVIRSLGYGDAAAAAKNTTKFSDVAADFWASGYINLANSLGIIKGRPDGTFGPNDKVLYEEAVTMVVRGLGYEPAAIANGGYPSGYLVIGSQEDVTKNAAAASGTQASRGLVAKLVDNSLEVEMMGQKTYGTEIRYEKNGKTLLTDGLKLKEYVASVTSIDTEKNQMKVKLANDEAYGDKQNSNQTYDVFSTLNINGLAEAQVTLWVKEIDNANDVVYSIKTNSVTLYDYISKVNGEDAAANLSGDTVGDITDITLKNADETYDKADAGFSMDLNNTSYGSGQAASQLLGKFAKVVIVEGKVKTIDAYALTEGGLVTDATDADITYTKNDVEGKKIRSLDGADNLMVVLDGKVATLSDVAPDMIVDFWNTEKNYVVVASSKKAEGSLDSVYTGKIYIDGTKYDLDDQFNAGSAVHNYYSIDNGDEYDPWVEADAGDALIGTDVVGYVGPKGGKVRYVKGTGTTTTTDFWGVASKKYQTDADYVQVFRDVDGTGTKVTYKLDLASDSPVKYDNVNSGTTNGNDVYKFVINSDNEITKITAATWENDAVGSDGTVDTTFGNIADFDSSKGAIEVNATGIFYTSGSKIFSLMKDSDKSFDPKLVAWDSLKSKSTPAMNAVTMKFNDTAKDKPDVAVILSGYSSIAESDTFVAFVTDKVRIDKDNYQLTVTLPDGTTDVKLTVDEDDDLDCTSKSFIKYEKTTTENKIKVVDYNDITGTTAGENNDAYDLAVAANVYDIDNDGAFVKFAEGDVNWTKIASDVVVYEKDGSDWYQRDVKDIEDKVANGVGDKIYYYVVDSIVKGIIYIEQ